MRKELASKVLEDRYLGNQGKKPCEKYVVSEFLKRLNVNLELVQICSDEKPDFLIELPNGLIIGLEVTAYHFDAGKNGSKHIERFNKWRKVSHSLRCKLTSYGKGLEFWYGAIHFKPQFSSLLDKAACSSLVEELFKLAKNQLINCAETEIRLTKKYFPKSKYPLIYERIEHIYCRNTYPEKDILWWHASLQTGPVPDPTDGLQKIIRKKENKARNYSRLNMCSLWLLIFARAGDISETAVLSDQTNLGQFQNLRCKNFNNVFLWDKFTETIWELWPRQQSLINHDGKNFVLHINRIPPILHDYCIQY